MSSIIIAAEKSFDIGCKVLLWNEPGGLNLYPYKKFTTRKINLEQLQKQTAAFTLHHSVTYTAKQTFGGLVSRGLSVNFIIDDDDVGGYATIFQCLNIVDAGWSQAPLNLAGPGVEISYQPAAWNDNSQQMYSEINRKKYGVQPHPTVYDTVHGQRLKIYPPTQAQINSCTALAWGVCELLQIPPEFPKDLNGKISRTVIKEPLKHTGLILHSNITRNKVDPLGMPLEQMESEIKARMKWGF